MKEDLQYQWREDKPQIKKLVRDLYHQYQDAESGKEPDAAAVGKIFFDIRAILKKLHVPDDIAPILETAAAKAAGTHIDSERRKVRKAMGDFINGIEQWVGKDNSPSVSQEILRGADALLDVIEGDILRRAEIVDELELAKRRIAELEHQQNGHSHFASNNGHTDAPVVKSESFPVKISTAGNGLAKANGVSAEVHHDVEAVISEASDVQKNGAVDHAKKLDLATARARIESFVNALAENDDARTKFMTSGKFTEELKNNLISTLQFDRPENVAWSKLADEFRKLVKLWQRAKNSGLDKEAKRHFDKKVDQIGKIVAEMQKIPAKKNANGVHHAKGQREKIGSDDGVHSSNAEAPVLVDAPELSKLMTNLNEWDPKAEWDSGEKDVVLEKYTNFHKSIEDAKRDYRNSITEYRATGKRSTLLKAVYVWRQKRSVVDNLKKVSDDAEMQKIPAKKNVNGVLHTNGQQEKHRSDDGVKLPNTAPVEPFHTEEIKEMLSEMCKQVFPHEFELFYKDESDLEEKNAVRKAQEEKQKKKHEIEKINKFLKQKNFKVSQDQDMEEIYKAVRELNKKLDAVDRPVKGMEDSAYNQAAYDAAAQECAALLVKKIEKAPSEDAIRERLVGESIRNKLKGEKVMDAFLVESPFYLPEPVRSKNDARKAKEYCCTALGIQDLPGIDWDRIANSLREAAYMLQLIDKSGYGLFEKSLRKKAEQFMDELAAEYEKNLIDPAAIANPSKTELSIADDEIDPKRIEPQWQLCVKYQESLQGAEPSDENLVAFLRAELPEFDIYVHKGINEVTDHFKKLFAAWKVYESVKNDESSDAQQQKKEAQKNAIRYADFWHFEAKNSMGLWHTYAQEFFRNGIKPGDTEAVANALSEKLRWNTQDVKKTWMFAYVMEHLGNLWQQKPNGAEDEKPPIRERLSDDLQALFDLLLDPQAGEVEYWREIKDFFEEWDEYVQAEEYATLIAQFNSLLEKRAQLNGTNKEEWVVACESFLQKVEDILQGAEEYKTQDQADKALKRNKQDEATRRQAKTEKPRSSYEQRAINDIWQYCIQYETEYPGQANIDTTEAFLSAKIPAIAYCGSQKFNELIILFLDAHAKRNRVSSTDAADGMYVQRKKDAEDSSFKFYNLWLRDRSEMNRSWRQWAQELNSENIDDNDLEVIRARVKQKTGRDVDINSPPVQYISSHVKFLRSTVEEAEIVDDDDQTDAQDSRSEQERRAINFIWGYCSLYETTYPGQANVVDSATEFLSGRDSAIAYSSNRVRNLTVHLFMDAHETWRDFTATDAADATYAQKKKAAEDAAHNFYRAWRSVLSATKRSWREWAAELNGENIDDNDLEVIRQSVTQRTGRDVAADSPPVQYISDYIKFLRRDVEEVEPLDDDQEQGTEQQEELTLAELNRQIRNMCRHFPEELRTEFMRTEEVNNELKEYLIQQLRILNPDARNWGKIGEGLWWLLDRWDELAAVDDLNERWARIYFSREVNKFIEALGALIAQPPPVPQRPQSRQASPASQIFPKHINPLKPKKVDLAEAKMKAQKVEAAGSSNLWAFMMRDLTGKNDVGAAGSGGGEKPPTAHEMVAGGQGDDHWKANHGPAKDAANAADKANPDKAPAGDVKVHDKPKDAHPDKAHPDKPHGKDDKKDDKAHPDKAKEDDKKHGKPAAH